MKKLLGWILVIIGVVLVMLSVRLAHAMTTDELKMAGGLMLERNKLVTVLNNLKIKDAKIKIYIYVPLKDKNKDDCLRNAVYEKNERGEILCMLPEAHPFLDVTPDIIAGVVGQLSAIDDELHKLGVKTP